MVFWWALALFSVTCVLVVEAGRSSYNPKHKQCQPNQRGSLTALFRATSGHNWFNGWDTSPTSDPCLDEWYGITCDRYGNVITINLYANNLAGYFPDNFGQFPKLRRLDVSSNQMSKPLPPTFGNLVSLRELKMSKNHFQGDFPTAVAKWPYLKTLEISQNDFNAPLPQEISSLPLKKGVKLSMESYKCKTDTPFCKNDVGIVNTVSFGGSTVQDRKQPVHKAPTPPCPIGYHKMVADATGAYVSIGSYSDRSWCRVDALASSA